MASYVQGCHQPDRKGFIGPADSSKALISALCFLLCQRLALDRPGSSRCPKIPTLWKTRAPTRKIESTEIPKALLSITRASGLKSRASKSCRMGKPPGAAPIPSPSTACCKGGHPENNPKVSSRGLGHAGGASPGETGAGQGDFKSCFTMQEMKNEEKPFGLVTAGISYLHSGLGISQLSGVKPARRGLSQQRDNRC